jgi:uncharacterized membrane protein YjfL (UPF0719 family)
MTLENLSAFGFGLAYVFLGVVILVVAKIVKDLLTSYKIDEELTQKDNTALALSLAGYFAGVIIVFIGAAAGDDITASALKRDELLKIVGHDTLWALAGIVALNIGRLVVDKLVLYKFSTKKEIVEDRNAGAGAVEAGCYIATGLIISGAISGDGGGWWSALAFFALGQLTLVVFGFFYQLITSYDIHEEIEKDNVAAGVSLGSGMVAIGIILFRATSGNFENWAENLTEYGIVSVIGFVAMIVLMKITDYVFLPKSTLAHEIVEDRNIGAACIEGIINIGMAAVICFMI